MDLIAHQLGGFDAGKTRELFNIPAQFTLMAMISVGHRVSESAIPEDLLARETAERSRRPLGELFYQGAWANPIK
jgi:argininosuccinate synthase